MAHHYQVTTTTTAREKATELSHQVVEQRLAACAQVSGPVTSTYWLKTALRKTQGYMGFTTPEIVATPIEDGDADYLAWIDAETTAHSA
jgi:periplasmic divalent cation tolerance protein